MTPVKKSDGKVLDLMLARERDAGPVLDLMKELKLSLDTPEPRTVVPAPAPGVYENVPFHVYHSWDAASNSRLTKLHRTAAHLRAYLDQPPEQKEALVIGRAVHTAVLEPEEFAKRYMPAPAGTNLRTNAGKAAWDELEAKFGDGFVFKQDDYVELLQIRDGVLRHPTAKKLLEGKGRVELSIVWRDPDTDLLIKARIDKHATEFAGGAIVDLKTARNASKPAFAKAINEHGYHRQGALYLEGAEANSLPARHFVNIAAEKEAPYCVGVYRLDEPTILRGANELKALKAAYARCLETNEWPGYSNHVEDISLPEWAAKLIDQNTDIEVSAYDRR